MLGSQAACADLVDRLRNFGFTGSALNPADLDPSPVAVWVQPRFIHDVRLGGGAELTAWLYLIVRAADYLDEWALLDSGLGDLLEFLDTVGLPLADLDAPVDLTAAVLLDGHTSPSPAYRVAIDLDLEGDPA